MQVTPLSSAPRLRRTLPRLLLGALGGLVMFATAVRAQYIGREQDIPDLRLGQRVLIDDGTCPAGQVKEVSGAKMSSTGVERARKCIPRFTKK